MPAPLPGRGTPIEPWQQGSLDGLCGLYTIINGLCLTLAPLRRLRSQDCDILFAAGAKHLAKRNRLAKAVADGMSRKTFLKLAQHITVKASKITGVPVCAVRLLPPSTETDMPALIAAMQRSFEKGGIVSLLLEAAYDHFTTVTAIQDGRMMLFDSFAYRSIKLSSCAIEHGVARHRIDPKSVIAFIVAPSQPHSAKMV